MNCHLAITRVKFVYLIDACVLRRKLNRRFHNKRRREYEAIQSGKVIENVFNSKPSPRLINHNDDLNVIIHDPVENASTNTTLEYVSIDEFIDFKNYITSFKE